MRWKERVKGCMVTSFADNCGWPVTANTLAKLYESLERVEMKVVEC